MSNNEALRRLLGIFMNDDGTLKPGVPGGPAAAKNILTTRHAAAGPAPELAALLVAARDNRVSALLINLDENDTLWYGSVPTITDATGATLKSGGAVELKTSGPIYIYKTDGAPIAEITEIYA